MQPMVAYRYLMEKKRSLLIRFSVCRSVKGGSLRHLKKSRFSTQIRLKPIYFASGLKLAAFLGQNTQRLALPSQLSAHLNSLFSSGLTVRPATIFHCVSVPEYL